MAFREAGDVLNFRVRSSITNFLIENLKGFHEAISSSIGSQLLDDLMEMLSDSFEKIASLSATEEDKIRYNILLTLVKRWSSKISQYENALRSASSFALEPGRKEVK